MAVNINTLITGRMTIGSSGGGSSSSSGHAETIFTFTGNRTVNKSISEELRESIWSFDEDSNFYILDYDGPEKLFYYDLVSVDIGNTVTSIGNCAFEGCEGLTSVTIPGSMTNIGYRAFGNCSGLTSVTIPSSVEYIGEEAFDGCFHLTSVTFEGKTMEQIPNIEDGYGGNYYPWGINPSIISVA